MTKKMLRCLAAVALAGACANGAWAAKIVHCNADRLLELSETPAASVTTNGVTTFYATLTNAWEFATLREHEFVDVTVKLLKDATVDASLMRGPQGRILTLDLNDCVLAYVGTNDACVIEQSAGAALRIVDTATTHTPRYFTCDEETGLWTLTNEVTPLAVSGALITGGRAGAVRVIYGPQTNVISNVNLVGNRSASDGGAILDNSGTLQIENSTFLGNVAATNGGAVYAIVSCNLTDCRVEANVSGKSGGGLYLGRNGTLVRTTVVGNRSGTTGGGICLTMYSSGCFAAGTRILMADGSERNVEEVIEGDAVATFDHEGGTNSTAAVCLAYAGEGTLPAVTLTFASGTTLTIVDRHDLLAETTRKYVTLTTENASDFIGARFYNYKTASWDELTGVSDAGRQRAFYSLYTTRHINCVANGLLTVADDNDFALNIYELDENLKADADRLAADIATYGLLDYADYPQMAGYEESYDALGVPYVYIAIGKGLVTWDWLFDLSAQTVYPEDEAASHEPLTMLGAPLMMLDVSEPVGQPAEPYLTVGAGVVITGNVDAVGIDNVYLDRTGNAVITVCDGATDIDVGVTLSTGADIFGWTNTVNHAESFFSDNPAYSVSYTADGELALRAGIRVGGDAWATVNADGVCTVSGTGAMWDHGEWTAGNPLAAQRLAIKSVVISNGVTSVGSQSFHKFYAITNVSCAASVTAVGDHAFYRCASLEELSFAGTDAPTFGTNAYTMHAGISIRDGLPDVYPIPEIRISGYACNLYGRVSLVEGDWEKITTSAQRRDCRFFKIVLEK